MASGDSACHPARLERFGRTMDAVCDGLAHRAGHLSDALDDYRHACERTYRAPTAGTVGVIRGLITGLRDIGRWTGDVGKAFGQAAAVAAYMSPDAPADLEGVIRVPDAELRSYLTAWPDPYLGVPEGAAAQLAADLGVRYDPRSTPAWIAYLSDGGNATNGVGPLLKSTAALMADVPGGVTVTVRIESSTVAVFEDGSIVARFSQTEVAAHFVAPSANAGKLLTASKWVGRAGFVATAFAAGGTQWHTDAGLPTGQRLGRAATRGGAVAIGSSGGAWLGSTVGGACGPAAIVCSPVLGFGGGVLGAAAGKMASDHIPWMHPVRPDPGQHDLGAVREGLAATHDDVEPSLAAQSDRAAADLARAATADDPIRAGRVAALVPNDEALARVVAADDWSAAKTPATSTTTTLPPAVVSSSPMPDPWGDHPWN